MFVFILIKKEELKMLFSRLDCVFCAFVYKLTVHASAVANKARGLSGKYQHENKGKDRPTQTLHMASVVASHCRLQIIFMLNFQL